MKRHVVAALLLAAPVALAACATQATVSEAAADAGMSQSFSASYDLAKAAALEAVERLNVTVQGADENAERYQIRFSKPISAFSWGEVGVVNVVRVDDENTSVTVNTSKRSRAQITGTSEAQFAEQIFANMAESLERAQP